MLTMLLKRLSCGLDIEHDAETIRSFCEATHVSHHYVLATIQTYCHAGPHSIN